MLDIPECVTTVGPVVSTALANKDAIKESVGAVFPGSFPQSKADEYATYASIYACGSSIFFVLTSYGSPCLASAFKATSSAFKAMSAS